MKYGGRVMLAVAGGYVLGRTKKMKLAIMLAGMASGNRIARDPTQLLAQSARLVQSNPQFSALSDQVRGRLVEAGKGVAVAVVSRQMESLGDRLSERTEQLSGRAAERTGSSQVSRRGDTADLEPADDDEPDEQPVVRPAPRRATAAGASGAGHRGTAGSPRKRPGTSKAPAVAGKPGSSGKPAGGAARKRNEGSPDGGAHDA